MKPHLLMILAVGRLVEPRRTEINMTWKLSRSLAIPCFVLLFILTNGCQQKGGQSSPQQPRLTVESFEQIHEGMTMDEVSAVLGHAQAGDRGKTTTKTTTKTTMELVGVSVTELAEWTESSGDSERRLEIGFNEGKVAAAIYRAGDVVGIKPEVMEGRFRVVAGRHSLASPTTLRVVVDFGSPEASLLHFGFGESTDEIEGFEAMTPSKRIEFTISGEVLVEPQGGGKSLKVSLERLNPKAAFSRKFAIDNEQNLSNVLAFAHLSTIYEPGEPILLGLITGREGVKHEIILHLVEKAGQ